MWFNCSNGVCNAFVLSCHLTSKILSEKKKKSVKQVSLLTRSAKTGTGKVVLLQMNCPLDTCSVAEVQEGLLSVAILGVALFVRHTMVLRGRLVNH